MSELHARNIANDIQELHQIHLCGEAWDKIRQGIEGAKERHCESLKFERDTYKKAYENQINAAFLHNELKLWIRTNTKATRADILQIILQQEMEGMKAKLRNIKVM